MDKELEKAITKQKYDYYVQNRKNYSKSADEILEKLKNGYEPNDADVFELLNENEEQNKQYRSMFELKQRVKNGKISYDDFNYLIQKVGIHEEKMIKELRQQFFDKEILLDDEPKKSI